MEYKKRSLEPELIRALKTFPAILITGSRQAGKTTLLRNLLPNYEYVSFDQYLDLETQLATYPLAGRWRRAQDTSEATR